MIASNITSQTGLRQQNNKFTNDNLFQNGIKADAGRISQYNFHQGGYGRIFWINLPPMLEQGNKDLATQFKNMTEKGMTGFDGLQNLQAETADVTGGLAGNSIKLVTGVKDSFDSFTIKVKEHYGQPLTTAIKYWVLGTKDHETAWCTYNGLVEKLGWTYDPKYHTAELLYVTTDPTGASTGTEFACLITNIFPTTIPQDHHNMDHGTHDITELSLEFTGKKYESSYINAKAVEFVAKYNKIEHYMEFKTANEISV